MGEIIKFERRPKKLTGFLPPAVIQPKPAKSPLELMIQPMVLLGFIAIAVMQVWFREGWRDR
jgi:hypothetical protein